MVNTAKPALIRFRLSDENSAALAAEVDRLGVSRQALIETLALALLEATPGARDTIAKLIAADDVEGAGKTLAHFINRVVDVHDSETLPNEIYETGN